MSYPQEHLRNQANIFTSKRLCKDFLVPWSTAVAFLVLGR